MKIIWHSVAPFNLTGYGVQTREWVRRLMKAGHDVWIIPNTQTHYAASFGWGRFKFLPPGLLKHGVDGVIDWSKRENPDMVITLMDAHELNPDFGKNVPNWYPMFPLDHDMLPDVVKVHMPHCARPLAMSRTGFDQLKEGGYNPVLLRHGVDCRVFKPSEPLNFGKDKFVVGMVATNLGTRKAYNENLQAFAIFHEKHPDSVLYAHCYSDGRQGGLNLELMAKNLGISDSFYFPDKLNYLAGFPDEWMARMYSAFDVLLASARAEGFGIPLIEAQACGTPVITTNSGAMKENCGVGWLVDYHKTWTVLNAWQVIPNIDSIVEALEKAYEARGDETLRQQARDFATHYHYDNLFEEEWKPFLENLDPAYNMQVDGVKMQIEDDPTGGVREIVGSEITRTYQLDKLKFEDGDVVVDIGAQVGMVSVYLAKKYPGITVYAFEPAPDNYHRLLKNIESNSVKNITAFNAAVGDGSGLVLRGHPDRNSGGISGFKNGDEIARYKETMTFPDLMKMLYNKRIKLLKMDCEGAEYPFLKGNEELLRNVDHFVAEFHTGNDMLPTREEMFAYGKSLGEYTRTVISYCDVGGE